MAHREAGSVTPGTNGRFSVRRVAVALGLIAAFFTATAAGWHAFLAGRGLFDARYALAEDVETHKRVHLSEIRAVRSSLADVKMLILRGQITDFLNVKARLEVLGRPRTPDEQLLYETTAEQLKEARAMLDVLRTRPPGTDGTP